MNSRQRRLHSEQLRLEQVLPHLSAFVTLRARFGTPPQGYRFALEAFDFLVCSVASGVPCEPVRYDLAEHGGLTLVLAVDPATYPHTPWQVRIESEDPELTLFNPHVGVDRANRGLVCWVEASPEFAPAQWPVDRVLVHVLRIVAGETFQIEGFALHDDAKFYFHRHLRELPFAQVPDPFHADRTGRAPARSAAACDSPCGIEFLGAAPGRESAS